MDRLDDDLGDIPVNDVQFDEKRGVLYASTDFGVMKKRFKFKDGFKGNDEWRPAAPGLPAVDVPGPDDPPGSASCSRRRTASAPGR